MTDITLITAAKDPATVLPALAVLSHRVRVLTPVPASIQKMPEYTILFLDARTDLARSKTLCRLIHKSRLAIPIILILTEGEFAAINSEWGISEFILASASPAEVEARIRLMNERGLRGLLTAPSAFQNGAASAVPNRVGALANAAAASGAASQRAGMPGGVATAAGASRINGVASSDAAMQNGQNGQALHASSAMDPSLDEQKSMAANPLFTSGDLEIDEQGYTVRVQGQTIQLAYKEFELLNFLACHPGRAFTRTQLLQSVWGYDYYGGTRTVDVHIRRLRVKLGKAEAGMISTIRNVGYRYDPFVNGERASGEELEKARFEAARARRQTPLAPHHRPTAQSKQN